MLTQVPNPPFGDDSVKRVGYKQHEPLRCNRDSPHQLQAKHDRKIGDYMNLLVRAQSASSTSLRGLHTRLNDAEFQFQELQAVHVQCMKRNKAWRTRNGTEMAAAEAISSEAGPRGVMRHLNIEESLRPSSAVSDGYDIPQRGVADPSMFSGRHQCPNRAAEEYKRSRLVTLGYLPNALATRVLLFIDVTEVLQLRLVRELHTRASPELPGLQAL